MGQPQYNRRAGANGGQGNWNHDRTDKKAARSTPPVAWHGRAKRLPGLSSFRGYPYFVRSAATS